MIREKAFVKNLNEMIHMADTIEDCVQNCKCYPCKRYEQHMNDMKKGLSEEQLGFFFDYLFTLHLPLEVGDVCIGNPHILYAFLKGLDASIQ